MTSSKYRGAVVEDLQLAPAFCLESTAPLSRALEAAFENEFDYLPVLNEKRRPVGYLDVRSIKVKFENGEARESDTVHQHTTFFRRSPSNSTSNAKTSSSNTPPLPQPVYKTIHPLTPLEELESFFYAKGGAAGHVDGGGDRKEGQEFALVTDAGRKWVLAVASRADLDNFVKKRGSMGEM